MNLVIRLFLPPNLGSPASDQSRIDFNTFLRWATISYTAFLWDVLTRCMRR